ncbi:MAG: tripartite tricarboxylate transporter substrate-binding protein [Pseudolabrys sp.]
MANPGRINLASAGIGSSSQLAGELLKDMAGIEMTHIPYRGGGPCDCQSARWPSWMFSSHPWLLQWHMSAPASCAHW